MARKPAVHFTQELADEICERMADGESLTQICRNSDNMPAKSTVTKWAAKDPEGFGKQYARAREDLLAYYADEIVDIADDGRNDWEERETRGGSYIALNKEAVDRSKLRVEARKWLLTKLKPKQYGDKVDVEHSGEVGFRAVWTTLAERGEANAHKEAA